MRDEVNKWYRCTTREEMVLLVNYGFDYVNSKYDKHNFEGKSYFFLRTPALEDFLASTAYGRERNKKYEKRDNNI